MDDVTRLFRQLVEVLANRAPGRLHSPFTIAELYEELVPYRRYRRDLRFESIEDYEMAMLRFLAGDEGYAAVEPAEVRASLNREVGAINPTPGIFRGFGNATVSLNSSAVMTVLNARRAYEPPPEPQPPAQVERAAEPADPSPVPTAQEPTTPIAAEPPEAVAPEEVRESEPPLPKTPHADEHPAAPLEELVPPIPLPTCFRCSGKLPVGLPVRFCPSCGTRQPNIACMRCGALLGEDWQHCVACGETTNH